MKPIKGYEGYFITENGEVFSNRRGKLVQLLPEKTEKGYLRVRFKIKKVIYRPRVHRLVAEAFIGDCTGYEINHKDCNKENNAVDNLEIVTREENRQHAVENGLYVFKLTKEIAEDIRRSPLSNAELANLYNVHSKSIRDVKQYKYFK